MSNTPDHLGLLRLELSRLSDISAANLNAPIPHIEGWTVHSTIGHTGWVARYVAEAIVADPEAPPSRAAVPEPPMGDQVLPWFREAQENLLQVIDGVDRDRPCPTFVGSRPASWWIRRLSHEASMHRWDAYSAFASPSPIDADLARDGIDEILDVFVPARMQFDKLNGSGETLHLHATDVEDGEWMLYLEEEEIRWERGHAKGDVAARGPMSDLLLLLWSRLPPSRLEVFGDFGLLERWQSAASF